VNAKKCIRMHVNNWYGCNLRSTIVNTFCKCCVDGLFHFTLFNYIREEAFCSVRAQAERVVLFGTCASWACCFVSCYSTQRVVGVAPCSRARSQCSSHRGSSLAHLFHKGSLGLPLHRAAFSLLQRCSQLQTQSLSEDSKMALACLSRVHLHRFSHTTVCIFRVERLPSAVKTNLFILHDQQVGFLHLFHNLLLQRLETLGCHREVHRALLHVLLQIVWFHPVIFSNGFPYKFISGHPYTDTLKLLSIVYSCIVFIQV